MIRLQPWELADMRAEVALSLDDIGSLSGFTYNSGTDTWGLPVVVKIAKTPVEIRTIASVVDPAIMSVVQSLNISYEQYRQLVIPYTKVAIRPDDTMKVRGSVYVVVQAMQPDETEPLEIVLHCRKLGAF